MLGNDRRRLELAFSLLFSLPGTPMMQYGDQIGMGDDLTQPERECARTPMQWTSEPHAGFTRGKNTVCPVISKGDYGYRTRNVADQRRDVNSLLNWTEKTIRTRRECPEISWGKVSILKLNTPEVLALRYDWRNTSLLTLHNFASSRRKVELKLEGPAGRLLVDVFCNREDQASGSGRHSIDLEPYGYRWLRLGAADNAIDRSSFDS